MEFRRSYDLSSTTSSFVFHRSQSQDPSQSPNPSAPLASTNTNGEPAPRLMIDFSDYTVPAPTNIRSLQPDELRRLFLVSLEKMFTLEPESVPFRQPVDPEELGLTDYTDIIRRPMDLFTIRNKMNCHKYVDPWMYIDDVLLMFDNAWVYNRPESRVYKYCTKLAEVFQQEINPAMSRLGYKHGRIHQFNSQTLSCFGRPVCLVPRNAKHYNFLRFHLCDNCFESNLSEDGEYVHLPWHNNSSVSRSNFVQLRNDSENSYSPATELHRSYMRDAEMSRALVIRELLKLLSSSTTNKAKKQNIRKMLRLNQQLRMETESFFHQQRDSGLLAKNESERIQVQLDLLKEEIQEEQDSKNNSNKEAQTLDHDDEMHLHQSLQELNLQSPVTEEEPGTSNNVATQQDQQLAEFLLASSGSSSGCSTLSSLKSLN